MALLHNIPLSFYDSLIRILNYSMIMDNFIIGLIIFAKFYFSPSLLSTTSYCLIEFTIFSSLMME